MSTQSYKPRLLAGIDYGAIRAIVREVLEEVLQSVRVYGTTASGEVKPILVNDEGRLVINATTSAETSSVTIYGLDYEKNVRRAVAVDSSARLRSVVENFPSDYPDSGTHSRLDTIISKLDVNLSTRASESTVSTIASRLYDSAEDKSVTALVKEIRDKEGWNYLPNIDIRISDAVSKVVGPDARTITDVYNIVSKLTFDQDSDLYTTARSVELPPATATTSDSWTCVVQYNISQFRHVTLLVGNVGNASADIYVTVKVNSNGELEYPEYGSKASPVTLDSGQVAKVQLYGKYAYVIVYAKNTVSGQATTVRVEAIACK